MVKVAEIHGHIGPKGSGKSYGAKLKAKKHKREIRISVNPLDDLLKEGCEIISTASDLLARVRSAGASDPFRICWEGSEKYGLNNGARIAYEVALKAKNLHLLCDESHEYFPANNMAQEPLLNTIVTRGRHYGIPLSWTSVTPRMLSTTLRANSDTVSIFHAFDPAYQSYLKEVAGKDLIEKLSKAPKYSHIVVSLQKPPILVKP